MIQCTPPRVRGRAHKWSEAGKRLKPRLNFADNATFAVPPRHATLRWRWHSGANDANCRTKVFQFIRFLKNEYFSSSFSNSAARCHKKRILFNDPATNYLYPSYELTKASVRPPKWHEMICSRPKVAWAETGRCLSHSLSI